MATHDPRDRQEPPPTRERTLDHLDLRTAEKRTTTRDDDRSRPRKIMGLTLRTR